MSDRTARPRPELLGLLRAGTGSIDDRVTRALALLAEELGMETAFVARFVEGDRLISHVGSAHGQASLVDVGDSAPREETFCHLIATGELEPMVPDMTGHPLLSGSGGRRAAFSIGAHVGVPLGVDGQPVGALCALSSTPQPDLGDRDLDTVRTVAGHIGDLLSRHRPHMPERDASSVGLPEIAAAVAGSQTLEDLTRPLLELLHQVTGLDSTYLTLIDWAGQKQQILFSRNAGEMQIPEGLHVDWDDTLCRRSLDEGRPYTRSVPDIWPDSDAARDLGIHTYVSVAVTDANAAVVGTLCGASSSEMEVDHRSLQAMEMFAKLVGGQLAREGALAAEQARAMRLEERTKKLSELAVRDPLTGLLNRTGVQTWLSTVLPELRPDEELLAVAFVDVDRFKNINDTYGHGAGDELLRTMAKQLEDVGRAGDMAGRLGGDEFVVAAVLPNNEATFGGWKARVQRAAMTRLRDLVVTGTVGAVAVTDPTMSTDAVVELADAAMYRLKHAARAFS